MSAKRIGILGEHHDADVQLLKSKIEDRNGEARIIDLNQFPSTIHGSIGLDELVYDGIKLLEFDAFYIRKLAAAWSLPLPKFSREEWIGFYGKFNDYMDELRAIHSFRMSLARMLCERKLVVNPYRAWGFHHLKLHQLWILKEHGFRVPATMAGNNYFDLKSFLTDRSAVEKPVVTGPVRLATVDGLDSERKLLRSRPIVYQEFIEGRSIRAFVLGDDVIASCELPRKKWGVDSSEQIEYMRRIELPPDIRKEIVRAAKTLGLIFSGVDLQYRESTGEFFFLECNSAPYFRPYDTQTDADIGGKLADFLMEKS